MIRLMLEITQDQKLSVEVSQIRMHVVVHHIQRILPPCCQIVSPCGIHPVLEAQAVPSQSYETSPLTFQYSQHSVVTKLNLILQTFTEVFEHANVHVKSLLECCLAFLNQV